MLLVDGPMCGSEVDEGLVVDTRSVIGETWATQGSGLCWKIVCSMISALVAHLA